MILVFTEHSTDFAHENLKTVPKNDIVADLGESLLLNRVIVDAGMDTTTKNSLYLGDLIDLEWLHYVLRTIQTLLQLRVLANRARILRLVDKDSILCGTASEQLFDEKLALFPNDMSTKHVAISRRSYLNNPQNMHDLLENEGYLT